MTTLLLCYDGSDQARHAIVEAARLFPGARSVVLNIWKPSEAVGGGFELSSIDGNGRAWSAGNETARRESAELAHEAARLAQAHGLIPLPAEQPMGGSVWETVIHTARALGVGLIVTGGRGLSGLRGLVAGSLSLRLIQHSDTPVLVIPSPKDN